MTRPSIHTIVRQYDGSYLADGRANLEEVVTAIGPEFETGEAGEEVDTLGGYVVETDRARASARRTYPRPGQFEFEVLDADPRRIKKLRIYLSKKSRQPTRESWSAGRRLLIRLRRRSRIAREAERQGSCAPILAHLTKTVSVDAVEDR